MAKRRIRAERYASRVKIIIELLEPFYEPREALQWLVEPQSLLGGSAAADLIGEDGGMVRVRGVIDQLRDSAYV